MTFGRHRNDFCCRLADSKVRDEFRAKFKIPHSYDHLVSTSGQCDVSIIEKQIQISPIWAAEIANFLQVYGKFRVP